MWLGPITFFHSFLSSVQVTPAFQSSSIPRCLSGLDREAGKDQLHTELPEILPVPVLLIHVGCSFETSIPWRHTDLNAILFLKAWQNPNIAAPALGHLFQRFLWCIWRTRLSQSLQAQLRKAHSALDSPMETHTWTQSWSERFHTICFSDPSISRF